MTSVNETLRTALEHALGPDGVIAGDAIGLKHHVDWTGKAPCAPALLLRPRSTGAVAQALRLCHSASQPIVIQGGLTGLAGGATPRLGEYALTLERLSGIETIDANSATMTVGAGTTLSAIQDAAVDAGLQFPLDLGARGSCTIGGNLATNAGGNRVIRYGMARDLVLGLEAVLADGTIVSSMNTVIKNNTGYDLKNLFIGSEGTLGVITRAVLRLHAAPKERLTALVALASFAHLVQLLRRVRAEFGASLGSFEVMWSNYYEFAAARVLSGSRQFAAEHPFYVVMEIESLSPIADRDKLETWLAAEQDEGALADAIIGTSIADSARLWRVRDAAGELIPSIDNPVSYDISLPIGRMPEYLTQVQHKAAPLVDDRGVLIFGHIGDGNLHLVAGLKDAATAEALDEIIYSTLAGEGSVSAEHGIGTLKRAYLKYTRSPTEIALMRQIKTTLDPCNILNPGRVL